MRNSLIDTLKESAGTGEVLTVIYQGGRAPGYKRHITILTIDEEDGYAKIREIDRDDDLAPKTYKLELMTIVDENHPSLWMPADAGSATPVDPNTYFSGWYFTIRKELYAALGVINRTILDQEKTKAAREKAIALGVEKTEARRGFRIFRREYVIYSPMIYDFHEGDIFYRDKCRGNNWIQVINAQSGEIDPMLSINFCSDGTHASCQCTASQLAKWLQSGEIPKNL